MFSRKILTSSCFLLKYRLLSFCFLVNCYKLVLIIKSLKCCEKSFLLLTSHQLSKIDNWFCKNVQVSKNVRIIWFANADVYFILSTAPVHCRHPIQTPSPRYSCSETSPRSSSCSDNARSSSDCDSEPDQVSTYPEQPPKMKRQRTTFSPMEVWELERVYKRRPYLMSEDEEDLVQRLGITAKSLKVRFTPTAKRI